MIGVSIARAAALAAVCVLFGGVASQAHDTQNCADYGLKPVGLFVDGQTVEAFISDARKNEEVLIAFFRDLDLGLERPEIAALLQQINENPTIKYDVPPALQGIGGFTTAILLQRILDGKGNLVAEKSKPISRKVVYGKIRDYIFIEANNTGHLNVDVCTDDLMTGNRELFHWDVEISSKDVESRGQGFVVQQRVDDFLDPFPGITLPEAARDPSNKRGIWYRGLDHKLGAKGERIKVVNVYYRNLSEPPMQPTLQPLKRLDDSNIYTQSADSCVDLFTQGHPPATFGELVGNDYCLGRCTKPAIYNSGGD